jgi:hypothetical protein
MAKQSFLWTAMPNGYASDGKSLRVSALLSPRLDPQSDPPQLISFFPDWEDWPATLRKATFDIRFGGDLVSIPATQMTGANRVDTSLGSPDSLIWKQLFKGDLFVREFRFKDLSRNVVLSYDALRLASFISGLYSKLARSANGMMPSVSDIVDNPDWKHIINMIGWLDRFYNQETGLHDPGRRFEEFYRNRFSSPDKIAETLARFQLFHTPSAKPKHVEHTRSDGSNITAKWLEFERSEMPKPEDFVKQTDFHQIVSAMNSYPTMLRRLGIVIDFILDATSFTRTANDLLSISAQFVEGILNVSPTKNVSLRTHALLTSTKFQTVSNPDLTTVDPKVVDGLLDINQNQFDVLQVDVDSLGLKFMNFARSIARPMTEDDARVDSVTRFEKELGVPSLRNAGFMLVHRNRGSMLENRFDINREKNIALESVSKDSPGSKTLELWAEDLVRGYRFDIWDSKTAVWHSLCQRKAKYEIDKTVVKPAGSEETTIRLSATKSSDPESNPDLVYLHESIISWTGWSLAAPPPWRVIKNDENDTATAEAELPPGFKFKTVFKALPGSLPRLRFGRNYWLRARIVDLAGNSLPPQEKAIGPENAVKNARPYLRYEPVAAPVIALVRSHDSTIEKPKEGESMELVAIRSFDDIMGTSEEVAIRFVVPPQSNVRDAELHGKLDAIGKVDSSKFDMLANQKDFDAKDPKAALQEKIIKMKAPLEKVSVDTIFAVYNDGKSLTYLPDPIPEEVAVRIFDHPNIDDADVIKIPIYSTGEWPNAEPFKLQIFENSTAKPSFDEGSRTLLVPLPKAIRAKVRLSMCLPKFWLDKMGIWNWLHKIDKIRLRNMALEGQHWMLTPWRTIEIVHAVQRPLIIPEISKLAIQREYAMTSARPEFFATCSLKSTDRLDLYAEWHEPRDEPNNTKSKEIQADNTHREVAFSVKITDPKSFAMLILGNKFGGFTEHMIAPEEDRISINVIPNNFAVPKNHEFHDTRYRRIEYWLEGTTKFREYMPAKILTGKKTKLTEVTGPRVITWIPSSAPPPAPEILYIVPTFGWVRTTNDKGDQFSWRRGGGLRVYLDRPWNSSGYGEMLGVVLPSLSFVGNPENDPKGYPYKNYVTQWGNDPIWLSPFVSGIAPSRTDFPLARNTPDGTGKWLPTHASPSEADQPPGPFVVTGIRPPGISSSSDTTIEVAPHDVFYDRERQLWYCDIEIDHGSSYYPFVRLALARYQPVSVKGAHLSNIVLADFMPLAADRWLNVMHTDNARSRHITVFGNRYHDSSGHVEAKHVSNISVIDVWVERLNEYAGDDFGWEQVIEADIQQMRKGKKMSSAKSITREQVHAGELVATRQFDHLVRENLVGSVFVISESLWDGNITLPMQPGEGIRYRLVIAEYEEYLVDGQGRPYDKVPKKDRRLVFVEHIELT